ncbi:MAG: phosphoribosyltransferase [Bacteroidetes bacterium]|nr:phosphoribosyltransferase [Bacteroidota bacterium]
MEPSKTLILDHAAIAIKLERIATEICEKHTHTEKVVFCGLNQRGYFLAGEIANRCKAILPALQVVLVQCHAGNSVAFSPAGSFAGNHVVVVDDVINSGKTLMQVLQVIFNDGAATIETAFLAKREHRSFPVKADYVGVSLATTLQEHVHFDNSNPAGLQVYLS